MVLNLPSCQLFRREEAETLKQGYEGMDKSPLLIEDDEYSEWNLLFAEHDARPTYDFVLFRWQI